jgi:hypothetical protein
LQRLQTHLRSDSLAHKLVSAAIAAAPTADLTAVLKEALEGRGREIRSKFDDGKV